MHTFASFRIAASPHRSEGAATQRIGITALMINLLN
jgi:hypothetical protein